MDKTRIFICLLIVSALSYSQLVAQHIHSDILLLHALRKEKRHIDLMQKIGPTTSLIRPEGHKYFTYCTDSLRNTSDFGEELNIYKDDNGQTILITILPYDPAGDNITEYSLYFDSLGRTFAYERYRGVIYSPCTANGCGETITKFFDSTFTNIDSVYLLQSGDGKKLRTMDCILDDSDFPYSNFRTLEEFYKEENIE